MDESTADLNLCINRVGVVGTYLTNTHFAAPEGSVSRRVSYDLSVWVASGGDEGTTTIGFGAAAPVADAAKRAKAETTVETK